MFELSGEVFLAEGVMTFKAGTQVKLTARKSESEDPEFTLHLNNLPFTISSDFVITAGWRDQILDQLRSARPMDGGMRFATVEFPAMGRDHKLKIGITITVRSRNITPVLHILEFAK